MLFFYCFVFDKGKKPFSVANYYLSMQYCKENFRNPKSFWNTEMIKMDKFGKRKSDNYLFFVFFNFLTMKISYYYETVFGA